MQFRVDGALAYRQPSYSSGSVRHCDRCRCLGTLVCVPWAGPLRSTNSSPLQGSRKLRIRYNLLYFMHDVGRSRNTPRPALGPHPQCLPGFLISGKNSRNVKLKTHLHLVSRLRMGGAVPLSALNTCIFVASLAVIWFPADAALHCYVCCQ